MISLVRELVLSDHADLALIIGLLGNANAAQATAIGTGLGQAAVMAVKTDQAYATQIQQAIVSANQNRGGGGVTVGGGGVTVGGGCTGGGSAQPKVGSAVMAQDQVQGVTERGAQPITAGCEVYLDELMRTGVSGKAQVLLADHSNLSMLPATEIRLDKFVYDPNGESGNVVLVVTSGAFRFVTGLQPSKNYSIKTPYAQVGVRGTEFYVLVGPECPPPPQLQPKDCGGEQIQLVSGEVIVTTISGTVVTLSTPNTVISIDSQGHTTAPTPAPQPIANFAALGPAVTNSSVADAQAAYTAATGNVSIGSAGGGAGGGGGGGSGPVGGGAPTTPTGGGGGGGGTGTGSTSTPTTGGGLTGGGGVTGGVGGAVSAPVSPL